MGTFSTTKTLNGNPSLIPTIADRIMGTFQSEGYTMKCDNYGDGAYDISLSKGGTFKAVLGMKSALKITLKPQGNGIYFEAGVGIFGQQAVPTAISMFFFWPVLIPQIWGIVQQSKLDDRALQIAEQVIAESASFGAQGFYQQAPNQNIGGAFCPHCGSPVQNGAKFCSNCGGKL